jgi:hypothetical protein
MISRSNRRRREPPLYRGEIVTVCIAAVCPDVDYVVAVSDQMISSNEISTEGVSKMATLDKEAPWLLLYSGTAPNYLRLYERITRNLTGSSAAEVVDAIEEAYRVELLKIHDTEILAPYGISREDFIDHGRERFGEYKFSVILDSLEQTHTDVALLLAGHDGNAWRIFEANCWGIVKEQPLQFHAIGNGRTIALGSLYPTPDFVRSKDLNEIVYRLCAAKFAAESAPGVGEETFVFGLSRAGKDVTVMIPYAIPNLREIWKAQGQPPIPQSAMELLQARLWKYNIEEMSLKIAKEKPNASPQLEDESQESP